MAKGYKRTNPGDVSNLFIRCLLSDAGEILGGISGIDWNTTLEYFGNKCAYTGEQLTPENSVMDHAIPINRTHCGLHLYGNVVPATKQANSQKKDKIFSDHLKGAPERCQKIETFIIKTGYYDKAQTFRDLQDYCKAQYEKISRLCRQNKEYLQAFKPKTGCDSETIKPLKKNPNQLDAPPEKFKKLGRIELWANRPNQINYKIIQAYLQLEKKGSVSLNDLRNLCSEPASKYRVNNFYRNYASMKTDAGHAHGKVFHDDANGLVHIYPIVRKEIETHFKTNG